jgi:hypothetical protein
MFNLFLGKKFVKSLFVLMKRGIKGELQEPVRI